jgi:hypothetical protein
MYKEWDAVNIAFVVAIIVRTKCKQYKWLQSQWLFCLADLVNDASLSSQTTQMMNYELKALSGEKKKTVQMMNILSRTTFPFQMTLLVEKHR